VVTHFHPDHVGGAGLVARLTGARVHEGELDREQCLRVWRDDAAVDRLDAWFARNGMPDETVALARADGAHLRRLIHFPDAAEPLVAGGLVAGWEAVPLPGHADGQLGLHRD